MTIAGSLRASHPRDRAKDDVCQNEQRGRFLIVQRRDEEGTWVALDPTDLVPVSKARRSDNPIHRELCPFDPCICEGAKAPRVVARAKTKGDLMQQLDRWMGLHPGEFLSK